MASSWLTTCESSAVKGVETLVDDVTLRRVLGRSADELVVGIEVMRRRGGPEHDVIPTVRREHHVQKLGQVLLVSGVVIGLEDVEQVASLKALTQLLDRLRANAVDVKQVVLRLADEVAHGLDAHLAELVRPALGHAEVVEQVELGVLAGERAPFLEYTPPKP